MWSLQSHSDEGGDGQLVHHEADGVAREGGDDAGQEAPPEACHALRLHNVLRDAAHKANIHE